MDSGIEHHTEEQVNIEGAVGGLSNTAPDEAQKTTRIRTYTEKGLQYNVDIKVKLLDNVFRRLQQKSVFVSDLLEVDPPTKVLQPVYSEWMSMYEEFLSTFEEITQMTSDGDFAEIKGHVNDMCSYLQTVKLTIINWFTNKKEPKHKIDDVTPDDVIPDDVTPEDSVSRVSKQRSRSSKASSLRSSILSARLRDEQKRAELEIRSSQLKKKHELEKAKLELDRATIDLKLEAEELEINTELAVVEAKNKVIDSFEMTEVSNVNKEKSKKRGNFDKNSITDQKVENHRSLLNPESKSFIPSNTVYISGNTERNNQDINSYPVTHPYSFNDNMYGNSMSGKPVIMEPVRSPIHSVPVNDNYVPYTYHDSSSIPGNGVNGYNSPEYVIQSVVRQLRKPIPEIKKFSGDVLEYRKFIRQFQTKIVINSESDSERMHYLEQFTAGEAAKVVAGFGYSNSESDYRAAMAELEERYGRDDIVAHAFVKKALDWPIVRADSAKSLDEFSLFLAECGNAVTCIDAAKILEYPDNLKRLVAKLPFYLHDKWRNQVQRCRIKGETLKFHMLVELVREEARKATDPIFGKEAMSASTASSKPLHKSTRTSHGKSVFSTKSAEIKEDSLVKDLSSTTVSSRERTFKVDKPCDYCDKHSHSFQQCYKFKALSIADRIQYLKSKGYCFGCMKFGHMKRECRNKAICSDCKGRHPTSLHTTDSSQQWSAEKTNKDTNNDETSVKIFSTFSQPVNKSTGAGNGECTMAVIPVRVRTKKSCASICTYAFLDPGSSVSFCSEQLRKQLGVEGTRMRITLDTMAEPFAMDTYAIDGLVIGDLEFENSISMPKTYTKDRIPVDKTLIPTNHDVSKWSHLTGIDLPVLDADIGLLIGNNVPDAYVPKDVRTGPRGCPYAAKTMLGWVVWGLVRPSFKSARKDVFTVNRVDVASIEKIHENERLELMVREAINRDFPERVIDEVKEASQEDKRFLNMMDTSMNLIDGHYQVGLPFRDPKVKLPNNLDQAKQRLHGLKKKMKKNPKFHNDYVEFMNKILDSGFAELVPEEELDRNDGRVWYIPHHGVYHPRKLEKIRVVFDCAAQFYGVSINNLLLQGPDLTNNLLSVLLRFRQSPVAIMGDITSMFYQVRLPKNDCDCLRFMWWPKGNLDAEPSTYRMLVHLFGATSSPSCCNAALRKTALDNQTKFGAEITNTIFKSFYVDDCLKSTDSIEEAISLQKGVTRLCHMGGFELSKWSSNSSEVLESIPVNDRAKEIKLIDLQKDALPNERALGVHWAVQTDTLGFNIQLNDKPATRRGLLSITSAVYDPLGLSAPFTLLGKQLLQDLCKRGVDWDELIVGKDLQKWERWLADLPRLQHLSLPRCYKPVNFGTIARCELHLFSDASETGYGIVSYLRLINDDGNIHCSFVLAKARVVPTKKITIPRLELTAATMAAKISLVITREFEYQIDSVSFWTDSMSVLRYIQSEVGRFQTFVANRITLIREISDPCQWRYVDSKSNPADATSRGQDMDSFLNNSAWFSGPPFLHQPEAEWQLHELNIHVATDDPEVKRTAFAASEIPPEPLETLIHHYSRWWKLKRTVGWFILAMNNLKDWVATRKQLLKTAHLDKTLSVDERVRILKTAHQREAITKIQSVSLPNVLLDKAEMVLIRHTQKTHFPEAIEVLGTTDHTQRRLKKSSQIYKLDPFVEDGVLRVGGRLERANINYSAKHPILLPKKSRISHLILEDSHRSLGHLGKNYILASTRVKYWIVGANSLIKSLVAKCVICKKYQGKVGSQKMADLPKERLVPDEPPFSRVGIDFFGPFLVKRGRSSVKRYGVVFTCLAMRAVHLEVAYSMDTSSCINAIRRFIARRGSVRMIRSDNGTNLVGSMRELREEIKHWNQTHISEFLQQHNITWEFNPPAASHFGGVWERVIRSVRKILYSLLQEQSVRLDDEALHTLLCEVEAILNTRPLTEAPCIPNDLKVLTPNDLLLLQSGETLPPGVFRKQDSYSRRRWRHVQYLADIFWKRWVREYLPMLQERQKWIQPQRNLAVGDIVLLMDNTPRSSWALGKVLDVFRDKKGCVRSVRVKTQYNVLVRPTDKLCLILEEDLSSN